jgi:hypothetical protein
MKKEYDSYSTKDAVIIKQSPAGMADLTDFRNSFKQNIQILQKLIDDIENLRPKP